MKTIVAKFLIVIAACLPFVWLSWVAAVPHGVRTVTWEPGGTSPFIQSPLPAERVSEVQESDRGDFVTIEREPVYLAVFSPSEEFTSAKVTMEFDPHHAFAVELGGLTNLAAYAFDFHALSNSTLESLAWKALAQSDNDTMMVFARQDVKASVADFLSHVPVRSSVVTYRATLLGVYRDPSYSPLNAVQQFDVSLRGSHEYVTYIKGETFRTSMSYQDINRTFGADEGYVRVYNEDGGVMLEKLIADDGNATEDQVYSSKTIDLVGANWPEGVYRVELSGTSDIIWRKFVTSQRYMSFKNRLFIADDVGYLSTDRQTNFVTNSKSVVLETLHADPAHSVVIGDETIAIPASHAKEYVSIEDGGVVAGKTSSGDVKMTGEGKFAFSKSAFFDPDPLALTANSNLNDPSLQYVLANVPGVQTTNDGWRTATADFDLTKLEKEFGAYKFALGLPGLAVDGETIDLRRVIVTFEKEPISLFTAVKNELRRWRNAFYERL
jgi:hypothetical protein